MKSKRLMAMTGPMVEWLAAVIVLLSFTSTVNAATLYEETFNKNASGNLSFNRTIVGAAGPATIVLTNGSGGEFNGVKKGAVELNTTAVFGGLDFKVTGQIVKNVALVDGSNSIDITLGGPVGGTMTLQVIQGPDQPVLEFPTGTIFVSKASIDSQDSANCGTKTLPCKTIGHALTRGGSPVVVASGIYAESVTLNNGQDLLGGYNPEFTVRDMVAFRPVLRGDPVNPSTVTANNINSQTMFEGFIVFAPSRNVPSGDSIGINIENSTNALRIQNNLVFGGVASDGTDGLDGANGTNGGDGQSGQGSGRFRTTDTIYMVPGGAGGSSNWAIGGQGGNAGKPIYEQEQGYGGNGDGLFFPTEGGAGGWDSYSYHDNKCGFFLLPTTGEVNGKNGQFGERGQNGSAGTGGVSGVGVVSDGSAGVNGGHGSGGGGGGAGGGSDAPEVCDSEGWYVITGPSGGGGGGGGTGGTGGVGGSSGGSAYGIFVAGTDIPVIGSNEIYLGIGGKGGRGGNGGTAGTGGLGGIGGSSGWFFSTSAGSGGNGGRGGHGGGGGGGAGGVSVGIYANFDAAGSYDVNNTIHSDSGSLGVGGVGGNSLGFAGLPGQDGTKHATLFQP